MQVNREYKDSVFTTLFSDKEKLLDLYNAIEGTNYGKDAKIEINTLKNVLYLGRHNDISFVIDDRVVVLVEAQSTPNENMPIRMLLYMSKLYEKMIDKKSMYRKHLLKIPRPEFIVVYNGQDDYPDMKQLKLSDAFMALSCNDIGENLKTKELLELTVTVYNINEGRNPEILKRSKDLNDYATLIDRIKDNLLAMMEVEESVNEAIEYCIREDIMAEFLREHSSGVKNMLLEEYNADDHARVAKEEGFEEGRSAGKAEGKAEATLEAARNMKAEGISIDTIVKVTGLSVSEIETL